MSLKKRKECNNTDQPATHVGNQTQYRKHLFFFISGLLTNMAYLSWDIVFACVIARSTFSDFTTNGSRKQFRVIVPGEVKCKQPSLCSVQTDISSRRPCPLLCPHCSVQTGSCFRAALHFRLSTLVSFVWLTIPDQAKGVENAQVNDQKMRGLMST